MVRIGNLYGPDATFLGVPAADLDAPQSWSASEAVIVGAPFDGGTSHRAGCRFGPLAIRTTDYLPHDGQRPHLALGVEPLTELGVVDIGDVEMPSGEMERSIHALEEVVATLAAASTIPVVLGGDHTIALPDVTGVARHVGFGNVGILHFDAHADTGDTQLGSLYGHGTPMRRLIESGACRGDRFIQIGLRGYWPRARDAVVDGGARDAQLRDDRGHRARPRRRARRGLRARDRRVRGRLRVGRRRRGRPGPPRHRHPRAGGPHVEPALGGRPAHRDGAARRRARRRRGLAALRHRGDHRLPRQPGRARGPVGDRLARSGEPRARPARPCGPAARRTRCARPGPRATPG